MMGSRRRRDGSWVLDQGERNEPERVEALEMIGRMGRILKAARDYVRGGSYAPGGGALSYLEKDARKAFKLCGRLAARHVR